MQSEWIVQFYVWFEQELYIDKVRGSSILGSLAKLRKTKPKLHIFIKIDVSFILIELY